MPPLYSCSSPTGEVRGLQDDCRGLPLLVVDRPVQDISKTATVISMHTIAEYLNASQTLNWTSGIVDDTEWRLLILRPGGQPLPQSLTSVSSVAPLKIVRRPHESGLANTSRQILLQDLVPDLPWSGGGYQRRHKNIC